VPTHQLREKPVNAEARVLEKDIFPVLSPDMQIALPEIYALKMQEKINSLKLLPYTDAMESITTPEEAAAYITAFMEHGGETIDSRIYFEPDYCASFKVMHQRLMHCKKIADDCDGGALAAAALLQDNGFPSHILILETFQSPYSRMLKTTSHAVFLYRTQTGFGSLGINPSDMQQPVHKNISSLVRQINTASKQNYQRFSVYDLSRKYADFASNNKNNDVYISGSE